MLLAKSAKDSVGKKQAQYVSNAALALARTAKMPERFVIYDQDYQPRHYFGAKLEPKTGVIHGAGQDTQGYVDYSNLFPADQRPMMHMTYITITAGPEYVDEWRKRTMSALKNLEAQGQKTVLQIGLNMTEGLDDGSGSAKKVKEGTFDEAITHFIDALEAFGVPAYVRIGYEFEGEWNNYSPEGFVEAFQIITDRIREREIKDIATVWCSAGGSAGFISFSELMTYYPGDEYVDWWGVDIFSPEELPHPWLNEFYDLAAQHQKPVMIGEATPRYVGVHKNWMSWVRWYKPFFEMVRDRPEIKAISYINWDWAYWSDALGFEWHDWEDARIQEDDVVKTLYLEELNHDIWLHAKDAEQLTN
ncbi:hypothetical protein GCM10007877_09930 [Marinibactrum halimedae]|uniref:GH26 domain-containing protein n=2 Tax=Marinibactrum halimedae TaxID=1444977 RepID=A0AA37WKZ6_9GAMM|nr:hypothetical protein GCM10007877_09930 [Marinibactrum halimedae]